MKGGSVILKDWNKLKLVKRVQELEKRGYVCATPIRTIKTSSKQFDYVMDGYSGNKRKFVGTQELDLFMVKMTREETA
ncbi:hypothetical protein CHH83_19670 [Bacillus sp. 7586-K]|nr:hypothetical protein CHH83_19670 [Bacillus sp. 7586-K]